MLQVQFFDTATVTRENKLTQKHKIFASPHGAAGYPERNLHTTTRQNPRAGKTSTQNFRTAAWRSYPERNLHTATRQTRMPGKQQREIFAAPIGAAAPKPIYTQHCVDVFLALGFGALLHLCCDLPWVAKGLGWLDAGCPHNATCAQLLRSPDVLQTSASTIAFAAPHEIAAAHELHKNLDSRHFPN